ncbi:translation initiation factor IF-5A, partial [Candidatus Pacearchaeota archaeon CG10_big_fil_rev_8_21_14_0_10_35_13]
NVCTVRSNDISKSGKHGASKCRIEAIGILDGKKRVIAVPGSERFEVPMVQKCKGQILSMSEGKASLMDLESFETIEVTLGEDNEEEIHEGDSVEYWDVEGVKVIKRKI